MTNRTCGTCSFCCKAAEVKVLAKPAGEWCRHADPARPGGACTIYDRRPHECSGFACLWLKGLGHESDRPDKIRAMFTLEHELGADMKKKGAATHGAVCMWVESIRYRERGPASHRRLAEHIRRSGYAVMVLEYSKPGGGPKPILADLPFHRPGPRPDLLDLSRPL